MTAPEVEAINPQQNFSCFIAQCMSGGGNKRLNVNRPKSSHLLRSAL